MSQALLRINENRYGHPGVNPSRRPSFLRFLLRYPIFLLAFGPPLFRSSAIDATRGLIDFWSFIQVGLLSSIALRAILRLAFSQAVFLPRQIRSVLKYWFFLGIIYLGSVMYSPSRLVSMAYSGLYFLSFACVVEFVVDIYRTPPNWMQCLLHLRLIALLLLSLDLIVLYFNPKLVIGNLGEAGLSFGGGLVGPTPLICPMIAIISAYAFQRSLEPRGRSVFLFLIGLAGSLGTQSRGCGLALLATLAILAIRWAMAGVRTAYLIISGFMAFVLIFGVALGGVGGGSLWRIVNKGQNAEGIATGSGRTEIWQFVLQYCLKHPLGMGYVAGFRMIFRDYFAVGLLLTPASIGNAHNSHIQVLADAGWLALAIYLAMMTKILRLTWRFKIERPYSRIGSDSLPREALECGMFMLVFCFLEGIDTSVFSVPLTASFYWQNIIIAMILGISARMLANSRSRHFDPTCEFPV